MAQPVTRSLGDRAEAEEAFEFVGDGLVLAVEDLDVGQVQQVLGDRGGLGAGVPGGEQVGGFVGDGELDVAVAAGQPQVGVEALDGVGAEAELLPGFVADHDPQVAGGGELAHAASPAVEAGQRDADGLVAQRLRAGTGDSDWIGAVQSTSMVVWSSNSPASAPETSWPRASRSSRVSSRNCAFGWRTGIRRPARRWVGRAAATAAGWWSRSGWVLPCGVAGEVLQGGLDDDFVGGSERDAVVADASGSRRGRGRG